MMMCCCRCIDDTVVSLSLGIKLALVKGVLVLLLLLQLLQEEQLQQVGIHCCCYYYHHHQFHY